ncbi:GNAT family N-acetyltransferase [Fusobacteria bacterium ZRK30]|nr:GNAT family N-acetyltransferase [Fusobacteria bacterium ZRK30]
MIKIISSSEIYEEFIKDLIDRTILEERKIPFKNKEIYVNERPVDSVYIALVAGEPVGFFSMWLNNFHPNTLYFNMIVDKKYRRSKIGTNMYKYIESLGGGFSYLQSSFYETYLTGSDFLEDLGFKLYRSTHEPQIDTSRVEINKQKIEDYINKHDLEVLALSDIKSDNELKEVFKLAKGCYTQSHLDNPVKEVSIETWGKIVKEDLIAQGSFILKKEKRIIAFALMYENDQLGMDLGWRGVAEEYDFMRYESVEVLTNLQIGYTKKSGKRILYLEIDSTDKWSLEMMKFLKLKKTNRWLSYQKKTAMKEI